MEHPVAEHDLGELVYPYHCRVSGSPDRKQLAFTFEAHERKPITIVLPVTGALDLQRKLAQSLFILARAGQSPTDKPQTAAADTAETAH